MNKSLPDALRDLADAIEQNIPMVPPGREIKEPGPVPLPYILPPQDFYDPCLGCSNHPRNGGSGICHCTIPYMRQHPTTPTPRWQYPFIVSEIGTQQFSNGYLQ